MNELYQYDEEFRDTIGTVDAEGKRIWVYPKKPKGVFHNKRIVVSIILLGLLFSGPFIKIGGQPLMLFNFFERKFVLFGVAFWPQDFHLFGLAMITMFVFVILFTVIFGRIWCGWACPQTIFMEMVFRKIEYWIEGDANQQRKLASAPWTIQKIFKKGAKQMIFIAISILIAHTLMAYLVGIEQVKLIVSSSPFENWTGFLATTFFTGVFYWVFAYFREQACVAVCPYGRLQGVLLNKDSMAVSYDFVRGEPKGILKKGMTQEGNGDCIDCKLCVHACPTGIDIRHGTQLECVNCTACIDACDDVMTKIEKPKGLIRISSYNAIVEGVKSVMNRRVIAYSIVLVALLSLLTILMSNRSAVEATIMRVPGQLYQRTDDGQVTNLYNIQFVNKSFKPIVLDLRLGKGEIARVGGENQIKIAANSTADAVFFVKLPEELLEGAKTSLTIEVLLDGEVVDKTNTNFIGPVKMKP